MMDKEVKHILKTLKSLAEANLFVLDDSINKRDYVSIDLSSVNPKLKGLNQASSDTIQKFIDQHLKSTNKKVAYGGYLERRAIYNRSNHFADQQRNIHLGLDLWCSEGTCVLAAVDGIIHSFNNNANYGDYGPTIILQHKTQDGLFYTLYGHLSLESISEVKVGQQVRKGEVIGSLGSSRVNGDYAPHLHFQIIIDMQGKTGDYPGVSNEKNLDYYLLNCPDPVILLGLMDK